MMIPWWAWSGSVRGIVRKNRGLEALIDALAEKGTAIATEDAIGNAAIPDRDQDLGATPIDTKRGVDVVTHTPPILRVITEIDAAGVGIEIATMSAVGRGTALPDAAHQIGSAGDPVLIGVVVKRRKETIPSLGPFPRRLNPVSPRSRPLFRISR